MATVDMPKRFWCGPLGQHDDDWLTVWAWLTSRSKSAQASSLLGARIRAMKPEIQDMLRYTAERLGYTPEELMKRILSGDIDQPRGDSEEA